MIEDNNSIDNNRWCVGFVAIAVYISICVSLFIGFIDFNRESVALLLLVGVLPIQVGGAGTTFLLALKMNKFDIIKKAWGDRLAVDKCFAGVVAAYIICIFLKIITMVLYKLMDLDIPESPFDTLMAMQWDGTAKLVLVIVTVALAPIAEEWLFRFVLFEALDSFLNKKILSGFITAFLFSAIHMNAGDFAGLFVVGCMLQIIRNYYGLKSAVLAHAIFNSIGSTMLLLGIEYLKKTGS